VAKVKKNRVSFVIDMTPLVDITFLLLTFFMFTAKFKTDAESEQKFFIERPMVSPDSSKLPEQDLAIINIAIETDTLTGISDTVYYYSIVNEEDRRSVYSMMENVPEDQGALLKIGNDSTSMKTLGRLIGFTKTANKKTVFAIDADKRLRFKWVEDAMEILRKNWQTVFNYVTMKKGS
jgi:biopolymer transport protein ExbD